MFIEEQIVNLDQVEESSEKDLKVCPVKIRVAPIIIQSPPYQTACINYLIFLPTFRRALEFVLDLYSFHTIFSKMRQSLSRASSDSTSFFRYIKLFIPTVETFLSRAMF